MRHGEPTLDLRNIRWREFLLPGDVQDRVRGVMMTGGKNWRDVALRALILVSGVVAAVLFVVNGEAHALPALAAGSTIGACLVGFSERQEG